MPRSLRPKNRLAAASRKPTPYDLGKDLFGPHTDAALTQDIALNSKRLLREYFRRKRKTILSMK